MATKIPNPDLSALGRDVLLGMAQRCLELESRIALSRVEQEKPADEQTIPTCVFCDLLVEEGKTAIASPTGAVICERCIVIAFAELSVPADGESIPKYVDHEMRPVELGDCTPVEEKRRRREACTSFPGCGCTNLDACRRT